MASISPYSTPLFFFFSLILTNFIPAIISQPEFYTYRCSQSGSYTNDSIYKTNLDILLSSISSNTQIDYGFYNFSVGEEPNKVNAVALCRGDLTLDECRSCVNNSTRELLQTCPNQKKAIGWYDKCMLRYSNESIFSASDNINEETISGANPSNASDVSGFNTALRSLLNKLRNEASLGNSTLKFATGETVESNSERIYGLVQCTPNLSGPDCSDCLDRAAKIIPTCCGGKAGGRVLTPICNLRYENSSFYSSTTTAPSPLAGGPVAPTPTAPTPTSPTPTSPTPTGNDSNTATTVIVNVGTKVGIFLLLPCILNL